ncbi:MAG: flagellar basal-body rod protein FlgF [Rhodovarius sp.]|nr:flagellar basal-body rod protein FlgF [Rhodovarius sp.]MCX7933044.1 flagellar basal-body rod protein FlgF [Rhodovarius sp.]MDW8314240.1 flagellar basal-body rod protein FlgF [Rhodovarius sp.]
MDSPGYIILSRLSAQMRAQAVTAHNIANADTPGFRLSRPIQAEYPRLQRAVLPIPGGQRVGYAWDRATWRDDRPGPITRTGNPLDVAIEGEGFFALETPRGERYSRAGRFTIGADGRLVDHAGHPVLNEAGQPIAIGPNDTRVEIRGDGTILSENGPIGRLRVVRFADPQALRAEGDRLFDAAGQPPEPLARPSLIQGAVEGSNVQPVLELTRMLAELREFQLATQFLEREGERLSSVIERLLRRRN